MAIFDGGLSKLEIDEVLNKNKLTDVTAIFHEYHGNYQADDILSNSDVVLLAIFLRKGLGKSTEDYKVRGAYCSLGRGLDTWENAVAQATKDGLIEIIKRGLETTMRLLIAGLKRAEDIFSLSGTKHHIFKSGKTFTAQKQFENFLRTEIGKDDILLCDPYASPSTLYPFSELWGKIDSLKILTTNINEREKLDTYIKKIKDEMKITVEVKTNQKIHDRFLISGNKCWLIGTSIKDLGNKDCVIKDVSEIAQSLTDLFWKRWNE